MYTLSDVEKYIEKGKWKKVIRAADSILSTAPFENDSKHFSFMSRDTYCLYKMRYPECEVLWLKNHSNVAYCKGYALYEMKLYGDSEEVLNYCTVLDPLSVKIKSQLFSALVKQGKMQQAQRIITKAENDILSPYDACTVYSKLAFVYSDMEEYETALMLLTYSLLFGGRESTYRELDYIKSKTGLTPEFEPFDEKFQFYAKQCAKALQADGIIKPFPMQNLDVLKMLSGLYEKGNEPLLSDEYRQRLSYLEQILGE